MLPSFSNSEILSASLPHSSFDSFDKILKYKIGGYRGYLAVFIQKILWISFHKLLILAIWNKSKEITFPKISLSVGAISAIELIFNKLRLSQVMFQACSQSSKFEEVVF